jgi:DNA-binding transcriptional ArsR family regulator
VTSVQVEVSGVYDRVVSAQPQPAGDADLASVGALLAEPARAKVLLALSDGRSLPASMLAAEAGVAASTASHHLARLVDGGLISVAARGRHRYYALASSDVAELLEAAARVAPPQPITSLREGTRAHALRYARRCYDHLAGRLGVAVAESLERQDFVVARRGVHGDRRRRQAAHRAWIRGRSRRGISRLPGLDGTAHPRGGLARTNAADRDARPGLAGA